MPRWAVAVMVLAILAGTSIAVAVQSERAPAAAAPATDEPALTPVLSVRRMPSLVVEPAADRRLVAHLQDLVSRTPGTSCLTVAVGGRVVFSSNPDVPVVPASVQKLVTAKALLSKLDPNGVLTTSVEASAPPDGGVVDGDLWLVGGGDPVLMTDAYARHFRDQPVTHTALETLADSVVAGGVRHVRGGVVGDESRYDRVRAVPEWSDTNVEAADVGRLSALMVNDGLTQFPPTFDARVPAEVAAPDAATEAAHQLVLLLQARGVTVDGPPANGNAPANATEVAHIDSPPIGQIVAAMLRESDNSAAEMLTKELGRREAGAGTTADGLTAIRSTMSDRGLPLDGVTQVDGSGLASADRVTCGLVQSLLDAEGPASALAADLPVAGQTGTLSLRFLGSPVAGRLRAKTGTLDRVTSLAGYVESRGGAQLSFAYVINLPRPNVVRAPDIGLEDELGTILYGYPEVPDAAALGPKAR